MPHVRILSADLRIADTNHKRNEIVVVDPLTAARLETAGRAYVIRPFALVEPQPDTLRTPRLRRA